MKMLRKDLIIPFVIIFFSLFSCQNDDSSDYIAEDYVVTVVPDDNSFYLVTDNGETLEPDRNYSFTPEKKQRAIAVITFSEKKSILHDYVVDIHRLDTFLTKPIADNLGNADNVSYYGNDPVNIHKYWIGDGYLNLWFGTYWGNKSHFVNLIQSDPDNKPYEVEFLHNSHGDTQLQYGYSIVAFDLSSLPSTDGKTVDLIVKVREFNTNNKIYTLKYNSGKKEESSEEVENNEDDKDDSHIPEAFLKEKRIYNIAY